MPTVRKAAEPNPVLVEGSRPSEPAALKVIADPVVVVEPEPVPERPENAALEIREDGEILIGGARVGRVYHGGAWNSRPWVMELAETADRDGVSELFGTQNEAIARAKELLAEVEVVKPKVGRRRRGV